MGGRKKLSLSQMEKQQMVRERGSARKAKGAASKEKYVGGIFPPDIKDPGFLEDLRKIKVITPYVVASKYDLRLSVAKEVLRELERRGLLELVASSRYTRIYRVVS